MYSQQNVFVNDFEKIRFTSNPVEVSTIMGVVYNLKHDEQEIQDLAKSKIQNAYDKVSAMNWELVAKQFKLIIDKLAK
jgi:hypothetical protein